MINQPLIMTGAVSLLEGRVPTGMGLLAVKPGECICEQALAETTLPERPDYEVANGLLISARRSAVKP